MTFDRFPFKLTLALFAFAAPTVAQLPSISPPSQSFKINVAVDTKSGQPFTGLRQQDFTVLDNKTQRPIKSFRIVSPAQGPVHVILFLDAVNTPYSLLAYARENVQNFLKSNEGALAYPTAIAFLTDQGAQILNGFTTDGNALNDALQHHETSLRQINRSSEWSGPERLQICLTAFHQLLGYAANLPGRKLVIWISPGWPLISGPNVYLTLKEEQQIFGDIVSAYTQFRQSDLTLYNVNPVGPGESVDRANYFETFLKGVGKPNDTQLGDLGVQVLSIHSGGLAIESNSDIAAMIQRCLADAHSWYEISFDPLPAEKPNEYHHIEIKLAQRDLVARTLDGYYANLQAFAPGH
jgi:VWFA-related protein